MTQSGREHTFKARITFYRIYTFFFFFSIHYTNVNQSLFSCTEKRRNPPDQGGKTWYLKTERIQIRRNKSNKIHTAYLFMSLSGSHICLLFLTDPSFNWTLYGSTYCYWGSNGRSYVGIAEFWVHVAIKKQTKDSTFKFIYSLTAKYSLPKFTLLFWESEFLRTLQS